MKRIRRAKPFARPPAAFAGLSFPPDVVLKLGRWNLRYWLLDMDMKGFSPIVPRSGERDWRVDPGRVPEHR